MPLANIRVMPSEQTKQQFDYSHWQDHQEIVQAINKAHGTALPAYPIYPYMPNDHDSWARRHQAYHDDMNRVLKTNASDLNAPTPDDLNADWHWRNFNEHAAARSILGI